MFTTKEKQSWFDANKALLGKNMLHKKIHLDKDGCGVLELN